MLDLKLDGNGRFTVHRPTTTPDRTGGALVELDDQFQEVARHETVDGLVDTDDHDSLLLPDGSRVADRLRAQRDRRDSSTP